MSVCDSESIILQIYKGILDATTQPYPMGWD